MTHKPHMPQRISPAERCYRLLLLLYPHAFRQAYGPEMIQTFRDWRRDARRHGGLPATIKLWGQLLADLVRTAPIEHVRAVAQHLTLKEEPAMLNTYPHLRVASRTDTGRLRDHNEDCLTYVIPDDSQRMARKGAIFVVADGVGGHDRGEVASDIVVRTVQRAYYEQENAEDIAAALVRAIQAANAEVTRQTPRGSRMAATCTAAVICGDTAYIANVGDSRTYLLRDGQVQQITRDHSLVAELMRAGVLTEDQAQTHPMRHFITRSLGGGATVEVDVFREPVREGDVLILCTDGLYWLVEAEEMAAMVAQYGPQESAFRLIECANERGGPDNITAVVAQIADVTRLWKVTSWNV